jgi:hypothetical protein
MSVRVPDEGIRNKYEVRISTREEGFVVVDVGMAELLTAYDQALDPTLALERHMHARAARGPKQRHQAVQVVAATSQSLCSFFAPHYLANTPPK